MFAFIYAAGSFWLGVVLFGGALALETVNFVRHRRARSLSLASANQSSRRIP